MEKAAKKFSNQQFVLMFHIDTTYPGTRVETRSTEIAEATKIVQ